MKKLLVVGGSGLLGSNWVCWAQDRFRVSFTYNSHFLHFTNATGLQFDLRNDDVEQLLCKVDPDVIVNAAGYTDVEGCEFDIESADRLNAGLPIELAKWCFKSDRQFIHISSDHLFGGDRRLSSEADPTVILNNYAQSKLDGESGVMKENPGSIIIRTNFFGWGPCHRTSYSDFILSRLNRGEQVHLSQDRYFSPVYVDRVFAIAERLLHAKESGVFHVEAQCISKFDFGQKLATAFGLPASLIVPTDGKTNDDSVERPRNMCLISNRNRGADAAPIPSVEDDFDILKSANDRRSQVKEASEIIPYGKHHLDESDVQQVINTLRFGNLTQGNEIEEFERAICQRVGSKYAVAVSSATNALHISYQALGLGQGDVLLTSPLTFVSTANAALFCNADVSFVDISSATLNLCPQRLSEQAEKSPNAKVIAHVLFAGAADGAAEVWAEANKHGLRVVEDASHALGGAYSCGTPIGSCKYSDCTVFSLHPVKSIAAGEGGIVTTNNEAVYASLLRLRSHGINKLADSFILPQNASEGGCASSWYYEMQELGYNYRLTDIQCSLAKSQLNKLTEFMDKRRELVARYKEILSSFDIINPAQNVAHNKSANHIFPVRVDFTKSRITRSQLFSELRSRNIIAQVHYIPVPMHPFYKKRGHKMSGLTNSMSYYNEAMSIPLYFELSRVQQDYVINTLRELLIG